MGHARALLALTDAERQREIARRVTSETLSVRDVERLTRDSGGDANASADAPVERSAHVVELERRLAERLGTRVSIRDRLGRGRITIEYYTVDDLDRVLAFMLDEMPTTTASPDAGCQGLKGFGSWPVGAAYSPPGSPGTAREFDVRVSSVVGDGAGM